MSGTATRRGAESPGEAAVDPLEYCRQIEVHLCRKNDGHLIRVVGPSFEAVSAWMRDGVPFKVACEGIDRYVERYYRKGPRRRPVRVEFCDADVRDVFDQWRRATGLVAEGAQPESPSADPRRGVSLPEHIERALLRLSSARATNRIGESADALIDAVSSLLDAARASAGGVRGEKRQALVGSLAALDLQLSALALASLDPSLVVQLEQDAAEELAAFRADLPPERFERARRVALDRLTRARLGLPSLAFT